MGDVGLHPKLAALAGEFKSLDELPREPSEGLIAPDLASYLPFVGEGWAWFAGSDTSRPRIIVYGMAQNLAGHPEEWKAYLKTENQGLTRLQDKWTEKTSLGIKPWQTMHAQVIVAFAMRALEQTHAMSPSTGCVTAASAYTNFVKWSSQKGRWGVRSRKAPDQPPRATDYARARPYVTSEVAALKPHLLIALGGDAAKALKKCAFDVPVLQVRHSSSLVLNPLRGIAKSLADGAQSPALHVEPEVLVAGWMKTLEGLEFRQGDDEGSTIQKPDELHAALVRDWLYYALAERQIAAAITPAAVR